MLIKPKLKKTHDFCLVKKPDLNVVFLHGLAADSKSFYDALKYLENTPSLKTVRFVTYDWLGHGKSRDRKSYKYDFYDQLRALNRSLTKLGNQPTVFVAHSMGAILAAKYADTYKKSIKKLVLVSAPIFRPDELMSDEYNNMLEIFTKIVKQKTPKIAKSRAYRESVKNILFAKKTYSIVENLKTKTVFITGTKDDFISQKNIRALVKANSKYLENIEVEGKHSLSREKYAKILAILEKYIHETL